MVLFSLGGALKVKCNWCECTSRPLTARLFMCLTVRLTVHLTVRVSSDDLFFRPLLPPFLSVVPQSVRAGYDEIASATLSATLSVILERSPSPLCRPAAH